MNTWRIKVETWYYISIYFFSESIPMTVHIWYIYIYNLIFYSFHVTVYTKIPWIRHGIYCRENILVISLELSCRRSILPWNSERRRHPRWPPRAPQEIAIGEILFPFGQICAAMGPLHIYQHMYHKVKPKVRFTYMLYIFYHKFKPFM